MTDITKAVIPELKFFIEKHSFLFDNSHLHKLVNSNANIINNEEKEDIRNIISHIQDRCEHRDGVKVIRLTKRGLFYSKKILVFECKLCGKRFENINTKLLH